MANHNTTKTMSGALRLQAYRQRLKKEELARVEILLPEETCAAMQRIASKEGAKYLETVSALAQLGLEAYNDKVATTAVASVSVNECALTNSCGLFAASSNTTPALVASSFNAAAGLPVLSARENVEEKEQSPLARFLKSRKGGLT